MTQLAKSLSTVRVIGLVFATIVIIDHASYLNATPAPQSPAANATLESPRLTLLKQEIRAEKAIALDRFWAETAKQGTPLVESIKGDHENLLVTFLWREQKDTRVIVSTDFPKSVYQMQLVRLLDSDVWYRTYRMRNDAHFFYRFSVDDPNFPFVADNPTRYPTKFQPDPLNLRQYDRFKPNIFSIVELPKAPPARWTTRQSDVPKGVVGQVKEPFKSTILNNERKIFIYRPPGFTTEGPRYPLMVMGSTYVSTIPLPVVLDNLIAANMIPPVVVLFVDYPDGATQNRELSCDKKYGDFLVKELLPAQRDLLHATSDPELIITGGASMSGLSAACLAFQHPEVFGNVLSQSGSYWWNPEGDPEDQWLTRQFVKGPKLPVKFFLSIGLLESEQAFRGGLVSMLHANRHFRDVLLAKGYTVSYREINSGHDPLNWQVTLADGLLALLGREKAAAK